MKKQISNFGRALNKAEQKGVKGGTFINIPGVNVYVSDEYCSSNDSCYSRDAIGCIDRCLRTPDGQE